MTSTSNARLENVKLIDKRTKDCVNGYTRKLQKLYPNDNSYFIIPSLAIHWIMLYYHVWEEFDPDFRGHYKSSANNTIIEKLKQNYTSTYLRMVASKGIHKWLFKINKISSTMIIGVWKAKYPKSTSQLFHDYRAKGKYYGWNLWQQNTTSGDGENKHSKHSYSDRRCKDGDQIQMILDLGKLQLSYELNGNSLGTTFERIEDCGYVVGVVIRNVGNSLHFVSYNASE